jgi:hypothetical protein
VNPAVRRWLRRWRQRLGDDPFWLPVVLRATPTGTARRLDDRTQLVVEGFPRSANTFAVFAVRDAERAAGRDVAISSHVHTPSAVKAAVRGRYPTLVIVRPPLDTIVSLLVAAPHVRPREGVDEWIHHHRQLWPYRRGFVVVTFDEVTRSMDVVVERVNVAFGTSFAVPTTSDATTASLFAAIDAHHLRLHGGQEHLLPRPSGARADQAAVIRRELEHLDLRSRLATADALYERYARWSAG